MQANSYYEIEIITWNHIIICIWLEYLKPKNVQKLFVLWRNTFYQVTVILKYDKKYLHKNANMRVQRTRFPNL